MCIVQLRVMLARRRHAGTGNLQPDRSEQIFEESCKFSDGASIREREAALRAVHNRMHGVDTTGAFIRSPWIMTGAWDTSTTSAHRLTSSNILQNNPHKTHATCGHRNRQKGWPAPNFETIRTKIAQSVAAGSSARAADGALEGAGAAGGDRVGHLDHDVQRRRRLERRAGRPRRAHRGRGLDEGYFLCLWEFSI